MYYRKGKQSRRLRKTEAYNIKKNIFAETYTQVQELKKQYNAAKAAEDEAGMQATRDAYNLLMDSIGTAGENSVRIYRLYEEARDCGNEYIDLHEVVWDKDVAGMIGALRENGISHFNFSSGWSGAVDTAWLFTQNGCRLEGLAEINSPHKSFGSDEYEKAHGYLFSIG